MHICLDGCNEALDHTTLPQRGIQHTTNNGHYQRPMCNAKQQTLNILIIVDVSLMFIFNMVCVTL